jgi:hypothetical protein
MIIYIFLSFVLIFGGTMSIFKTKRMLTATLFFAGALAASIFYGIRWFETLKIDTGDNAKWPPIINTCPDYLTYYKAGSGATAKDTCIDILGIAKGGNLEQWSSDTTYSANSNKFFSLDMTGLDKNDPKVISDEFCKRANDAGVTWEGIWDGESCIKGVYKSLGAGKTCT